MIPDFNKNTVDVLGKRAAFLCSNPDCRVATVGPNSDAGKSTTIGEAAHIRGARPDTARYDSLMSDAARAEITNAIWLCRNCHVRVDRDPAKFSAELLFRWREDHERFVAANLGNAGERVRYELDAALLADFAGYPPIVRRILLDKPPGWEWRLTAELLRYLNAPLFRNLHDLQAGMYTRPLERIEGPAAAHSWISARLGEMGRIVAPLVKLLERLSASWGKPGEEGNAAEIHHACRLVRDALEQIVRHEERLWFVDIDDDYEPIVSLLKDCVGSQALKLDSIPSALDDVVALIGSDHGGTTGSPRVIEKIITFEIPDGWNKRMSRELKRLERKMQGKPESGSSWGSLFVIVLAIVIVYAIIF